jgi:hypothetical protein
MADPDCGFSPRSLPPSAAGSRVDRLKTGEKSPLPGSEMKLLDTAGSLAGCGKTKESHGPQMDANTRGLITVKLSAPHPRAFALIRGWDAFFQQPARCARRQARVTWRLHFITWIFIGLFLGSFIGIATVTISSGMALAAETRQAPAQPGAAILSVPRSATQ